MIPRARHPPWQSPATRTHRRGALPGRCPRGARRARRSYAPEARARRSSRHARGRGLSNRAAYVPLCVLAAGDLGQRGDEAAPVGALLDEHAPPRVGNPVVAAAALAGLFHPPALDPAAIFEAIERRVERGERELQAAAGPLLDQLGDLVAVMALVFDDGENHDLGAAFLGFVERASA